MAAVRKAWGAEIGGPGAPEGNQNAAKATAENNHGGANIVPAQSEGTTADYTRARLYHEPRQNE